MVNCIRLILLRCVKNERTGKYADLMTPNLTELVTLVDRPYPVSLPSFDELKKCVNSFLNRDHHILL
mgnify:CR=1 FL=1